jgi:hypothetical protein
MVVGTSAFVLGFFVALGGWTATKLTNRVDNIIDPPKITKPADDKIVEQKVETKEKENVRRN